MESSDDEEVVLVRRRPTAAPPRVSSDGEEEEARFTAPVDASLPLARDSDVDDAGLPLDTDPANGGGDVPKPRLVRLKRRGDVEAGGQADKEDAEADEEGGAQGDEEDALGDESEDEEAVLERRVAENGTLSDGDSSDGEGKDTGDAEEQGALDAAVLARLQALREARKDKEAQELEQQHILQESASRVKFKGGAGTRTDMNAVLDRIRARAGAVLPAAPPDESMVVDAQAGRGHVPVVVPDDLGDLEALIIGGPPDAPGGGADGAPDGGADELLVLPQAVLGVEGEEEEEDGTGGMRLFGRAQPAVLQLRMDDTQADGDELAAMEEEEDPMAGEAAEAAAAEDALVSETESDTDEDEEGDDGDDAQPDMENDDLPPPQEALLTEEERVAQRAAVRAAAMQFLEEEKALRAAERAKAKAAAAAAAGGTGEKLGFMEDEAEMSEDGGHTDDDDASDTDDDLAELEAMLAAAEEGGDAEAADAIRAKIHAEWEQAADDRAVAGVVRAMQTGWRRRRGRRLRGEDGDVDDDDPRGPRRRRRGDAGGEDGGDDDLDVRNPFLQTGDGMADDDPQTQAQPRGLLALGRGAPAAGSFMSLLAPDDPSRAVLGLLRRRPMAPPHAGPSSADAKDTRGGGSFFSRGGLPEGASLPALPPRRAADGGASRAFVFARGDDSQGPLAPGDAAHTDTPQVGVRGAKAAARAAMAAAATAKGGAGLRPAASGGGTSLLGMLRSYSQSESQATGDVGENLGANLRRAQGTRLAQP